MNVATQSVVRPATAEDRNAVELLLKAESLPTEDLKSDLPHFFVMEHGGEIIGAIGLEIYDQDGLLRSMVVDRHHRNQSFAIRLLTTVLKYAQEKHIRDIYLITTTAAAYFMSKGFAVVNRAQVPSAILSSPEFSTLCPSTATVMLKHL